MTRILLINQAFVSPNEPGHTRHYELGQYLARQGDKLTIVASDLNYQTGKRITNRRGLVSEEIINGVSVLRTYAYPGLHKSFFWRIVSFVSFMMTSVWASLRAGHIDLILGTTPPIFQAVSAWFVALLRRKPFLLEVRDLWPEFAVDMGVLKNPILISLSRWLEKFLYAQADHILVNSPAYVDYLLSKGVPKAKITFIAYGADTEMFNSNIDGKAIRQEIGHDDKFIVLYAGALGLANDIDTVLRAAKRLQNERGIQFIFFGDGKERARLEEITRTDNLTNVTFVGAYAKHKMPAVLAAADVCLAILKNITMFRMTFPNKVFDYMAAGRPTILAIDGVIRNVIEAANGGIFVTPGNDAELAEAVLKLSRDHTLVKTMGDAARAYTVTHFEREQQAQQTIDLFKRLAKK